MPLTDTSIRAIKPLTKPQKVADGGGLYLLVTPNGTKAWRLAKSALGNRTFVPVCAAVNQIRDVTMAHLLIPQD